MSTVKSPSGIIGWLNAPLASVTENVSGPAALLMTTSAFGTGVSASERNTVPLTVPEAS